MIHNVRPSGPVSRPVGELVKYAMLLEMIAEWSWPDVPTESLRSVICPHWRDVIREERNDAHRTGKAK